MWPAGVYHDASPTGVSEVISEGTTLTFKATNSNTGASTLAVDGSTPITIKKQGSSDLDSGDIAAGQIVALVYDGTYWQLLGASTTGGGGGAGLPADGTIALPGSLPSAGSAQLYFDYQGVDQVPTMTSNTAPSGVCSASSNYSATPAYYAFDHGNTNGWITNGTSTGWIQYQFASAVTITSYEVTPWSTDNFPSRSPTAWTLEGSNDGSTWTTLDTRTYSSSAWLLNTPALFGIASPGSYAYYRLNVTANGGDGYMGVQELSLQNSTGSTVIGLFFRDSSGNVHQVSLVF
jgi:hypothetical protein